LNADDHDYRFYAAVTHELRAEHVLALGCGTGTLARLLASNGHTTVGIDPDPDMLRVARSKPGAEKVDWRLGYSDSADPAWADLAIMTGHLAQVFVEEESWQGVLQHLNRALRVGGTLAFETRILAHEAGNVGPARPRYAPSLPRRARWSSGTKR
jgi:SAM-dependent methyltransferase